MKIYQAAQVSFNQTLCLFCREDYQQNDQIIELACKHIFHSNCFQSIPLCPICQQRPIKWFDLSPKIAQLKDKINQIFQYYALECGTGFIGGFLVLTAYLGGA